jgi:hypothetical protein
MLEPGTAGYDDMDAERRALLDRLIAQGGIDRARAMTFKPVLLATLLTMAEYTKQGYRSDLSSEAWLAGRRFPMASACSNSNRWTGSCPCSTACRSRTAGASSTR